MNDNTPTGWKLFGFVVIFLFVLWVIDAAATHGGLWAWLVTG